MNAVYAVVEGVGTDERIRVKSLGKRKKIIKYKVHFVHRYNPLTPSPREPHLGVASQFALESRVRKDVFYSLLVTI